MDPISSRQFPAAKSDPQKRMRRLLQSAALAALAIGFATALPVSLNGPSMVSKAFADGGEGGEGGGGEGGGEGGGGEGGDHDGDHEGGNSGPGSDNSGPGEGGDDHHEAGDDEAGDDEHGERNEAGDDEDGDDGVIVPGDDDGTPDQGSGDAPAQ